MEILIGADPEVFVFDYKNQKFLSGEGMIPGTKHEPFKVPFGAIQVDGVALEFNIDPAKTVKEFVGNVVKVYDNLKDRVYKAGPSFVLRTQPVADFDPNYFEEHVSFEAKLLGCDPDYNAYTRQANEPPQGERPFRTASGHIHVGWTTHAETNGFHQAMCEQITKHLDLYLALPSRFWDVDTRRRELYGQLGAFRPKHYGLEYRVLSNVWVRDILLMEFVYNSARLCLDRFFAEVLPEPLPFDEIDHIRTTYSNKDLQKFLEDKDIPLPNISEVL